MTEENKQDIKVMYRRLDTLLERVKIEAFSRGRDSSFFASLSCSSKVHWTEDMDGISTDGVDIYISPSFFLSLSPEQRIRAYMDQLWHIGLLHNFRGDNKKPEVWQQACSIVVEQHLNNAGYAQMPEYEEPSHYEMFKDLINTKNQSEEGIYNQIIELMDSSGGDQGESDDNSDGQSGSQGQGQSGQGNGNDNSENGNDDNDYNSDNNNNNDDDSDSDQSKEDQKQNKSKNPMNNDLMPNPNHNLKDDREKGNGNDGNGNNSNNSPKSNEEKKQDRKNQAQMIQDLKARAVNNVNGATQSAIMLGEGKDAGSISGQAKLLIDQFLKPKVNWKKQLNKWFRDFNNTKTSFRRRNKRYTSIYMPSKFRDESRLQMLNYYIDISGSISNQQIKRFNSEIRHVFNTLKPKQINIIPFDTQLDNITVFKEGQSFEYIHLTGRGGTCLQPVREHILQTKPNGAVIFSDLYCAPMEPFSEKIPLLWVVVDRDSERDIDVFSGEVLLLDNIPD